jgi:mitogen-activated protein kinase 1/3
MAFILEGKLLKRGSVSWKSRHFVLGETSIQYFAKADDASVRGELALSSESELIDFSKRPFGFAIITGDKSLTVAASCAEEEIEWRAAIEEALELLRQNGTHKNSDGWHVVSAAGQDFEMSTKYELIKAIGHGAYGVVVSAIDHSSDSKVAIKKIPDTFEDLVDAKRIVREIHLLRSFDHDNVIRVVDLFTPQPYDDFNDVYIVSDLLDTDLHRVIYSQQPLTSEHIQYFLYQMLCGLNYIHSAGVIHRDLKPSNILMNANCDLRICDFGLSRGISSSDEHGDGLTEYVVTRWYRAPEIMLSCPSYDSQIDVWSMVRAPLPHHQWHLR